MLLTTHKNWIIVIANAPNATVIRKEHDVRACGKRHECEYSRGRAAL
jgi:hypothetical protein